MKSYFDLQLRFSEAMARADAVPMALSVAKNTNIHRRFGLGDFRQEAPAPYWVVCMTAFEAAGSHEARLDVVCDYLARAPKEKLPSDQVGFGCFSLKRQTANGKRHRERCGFILAIA